MSVRELERSSIREFLEENRRFLKGRVLDFGAGKPGTCLKPQPYRDLVSGEYVPFDLGDESPAGPFDAVLMTQVIQYLDDPLATLLEIWVLMKPDATLVITGPTNWPEIEESDKCRFTRSGIRHLLREARFAVMEVKSRAHVDVDGLSLSLGWSAVAMKP